MRSIARCQDPRLLLGEGGSAKVPAIDRPIPGVLTMEGDSGRGNAGGIFPGDDRTADAVRGDDRIRLAQGSLTYRHTVQSPVRATIWPDMRGVDVQPGGANISTV